MKITETDCVSDELYMLREEEDDDGSDTRSVWSYSLVAEAYIPSLHNSI